eukprot:9957777-Alexandrium_andersonii.AAC.1
MMNNIASQEVTTLLLFGVFWLTPNPVAEGAWEGCNTLYACNCPSSAKPKVCLGFSGLPRTLRKGFLAYPKPCVEGSKENVQYNCNACTPLTRIASGLAHA